MKLGYHLNKSQINNKEKILKSYFRLISMDSKLGIHYIYFIPLNYDIWFCQKFNFNTERFNEVRNIESLIF